MYVIIAICILTVLCFYLIGEIIYARKMHNYMVDKYNGLVERSNVLVESAEELNGRYLEAMAEYVEFSELTQRLLRATSQDEAKLIADKIYILVETGISRGHE